MKSEQDHDWLFLAGIGNSGNSHWQRHWQAGQNNCLWLEHRDWEAPHFLLTLGQLDGALRLKKAQRPLQRAILEQR